MKCCSCTGSTPWCTQTSTLCLCPGVYIGTVANYLERTCHCTSITYWLIHLGKSKRVLHFVNYFTSFTLHKSRIPSLYKKYSKDNKYSRKIEKGEELFKGSGPTWSNFEVGCAFLVLFGSMTPKSYFQAELHCNFPLCGNHCVGRGRGRNYTVDRYAGYSLCKRRASSQWSCRMGLAPSCLPLRTWAPC